MPHLWVRLSKMIAKGRQDSLMVNMITRNGKSVGSSTTLGTMIPIFVKTDSLMVMMIIWNGRSMGSSTTLGTMFLYLSTQIV